MIGIKLSVIIPTYNAWEGLIKCIESLKFNIPHEIIIIDDGSTDETQKEVKRRFISNTNIKYVYQENKGVSAARNKGIDLAIGDYIYFIDSDDYLINSEKLEISVLENSNDDLIVFGYALENDSMSNTEYVHFDKRYDFNKELQYKAFMSDFFITKTYRTAVWNKVYKRSIIVDYSLRFEDYSEVWSEDSLFNLSYISISDVINITILPHVFIMHTKNLSSLSNSKKQDDVKKRISNSLFKIFKEIDKSKLYQELKQYYTVDYVLKFSIGSIEINKISYEQFKNELTNLIDDLPNNFRHKFKISSFSKLYKSKLKLIYHLLIYYLIKYNAINLLSFCLWKRYKNK